MTIFVPVSPSMKVVARPVPAHYRYWRFVGLLVSPWTVQVYGPCTGETYGYVFGRRE